VRGHKRPNVVLMCGGYVSPLVHYIRRYPFDIVSYTFCNALVSNHDKFTKKPSTCFACLAYSNTTGSGIER
jgi:hypothetical protein